MYRKYPQFGVAEIASDRTIDRGMGIEPRSTMCRYCLQLPECFWHWFEIALVGGRWQRVFRLDRRAGRRKVGDRCKVLGVGTRHVARWCSYGGGRYLWWQ